MAWKSAVRWVSRSRCDYLVTMCGRVCFPELADYLVAWIMVNKLNKHFQRCIPKTISKNNCHRIINSPWKTSFTMLSTETVCSIIEFENEATCEVLWLTAERTPGKDDRSVRTGQNTTWRRAAFKSMEQWIIQCLFIDELHFWLGRLYDDGDGHVWCP